MGELVAFRLANWDTPLWASPNRRAGRFAAAGGEVVQYWSLHPLTPWAEYLRYHDIRAADDAAEVRLRPCVATLSPPHRLVEVTFADAEEHGTTADALVDDDWSRCQRWAAGLGVDGLVVPSAALPGTRNLILFGPKVRVRWGVMPPDAVLQVPCDPVADLGHGIADVLRFVRWRGAEHAGLRAWQRGEPQPLPPFVHLDR